MLEGGKVTSIAPGIVARVTQAARYVISGVGPQTWFGPMQPLTPMAPPEVKGRQFDYPMGYNLNYTPRSHEAASFTDLRGLADSCDILRSVIETRKDQMEALQWVIKLKPDDDDKRAKATPEQSDRIKAITEFFLSPDQEHSWEQWLRIWLEDMFVIDAACLYKRPNRKGALYGLEIIDGATIRPLIDDSGRRPKAPDPAYQQILKGVPAADYTSDELLYLKHNPRSNRIYGYSHVEQVLVTTNILIRRTLFQLDYYREGSAPDSMIGLPKEWTTDQIRDFQKHFDSMMSGNLAQRRKIKFMPGEFKYQATKDPVLKDEYDEFLARIVCFVFSLPPTAFVKQMNRATAQSAKDQAAEEGLAPIQNYVKNCLNRIIATDFESPDLQFDWKDDREQDPVAQETILSGYVKSAIMSIDEARERLGEDPLGGAYAVAMPLTPTGFVAVQSPEDQQAATDAASQLQAATLRAHVAQNGKEPAEDDEHGGANEAPPKEDASKLGKGVKKKRINPYLPTIGHRH
jgi:HK97 family phage portal protein